MVIDLSIHIRKQNNYYGLIDHLTKEHKIITILLSASEVKSLIANGRQS